MDIVLIGMLVCIGLAAAVLAVVAIPRVREGEKILTPDGEVAVREAGRRAKALTREARDRAAQAAGDARARAEEQLAALRTKDPDGDEAEPQDRPAVPQPADTPPAADAPPAPELRPASPRPASPRPAADPAPAAPPTRPAALPTPPPAAAVQDDAEPVIDLRDDAAAARAVEREQLARRLEWGEPEPGPRHRR